MDPQQRQDAEKRAVILSEVLWKLYQAACHRQVGLDGRPCVLCDAKDHAAFECFRFNAFVRFDVLRRTRGQFYAERFF